MGGMSRETHFNKTEKALANGQLQQWKGGDWGRVSPRAGEVGCDKGGEAWV